MINRRAGRPVRFHCSDDPCTQYLIHMYIHINVTYRSYIPVITGTSWDIIMIPLPRATRYFGSIRELGSPQKWGKSIEPSKMPISPHYCWLHHYFSTHSPCYKVVPMYKTWFINPIDYRYICIP